MTTRTQPPRPAGRGKGERPTAVDDRGPFSKTAGLTIGLVIAFDIMAFGVSVQNLGGDFRDGTDARLPRRTRCERRPRSFPATRESTPA